MCLLFQSLNLNEIYFETFIKITARQKFSEDKTATNYKISKQYILNLISLY